MAAAQQQQQQQYFTANGELDLAVVDATLKDAQGNLRKGLFPNACTTAGAKATLKACATHGKAGLKALVRLIFTQQAADEVRGVVQANPRGVVNGFFRRHSGKYARLLGMFFLAIIGLTKVEIKNVFAIIKDCTNEEFQEWKDECDARTSGCSAGDTQFDAQYKDAWTAFMAEPDVELQAVVQPPPPPQHQQQQQPQQQVAGGGGQVGQQHQQQQQQQPHQQQQQQQAGVDLGPAPAGQTNDNTPPRVKIEKDLVYHHGRAYVKENPDVTINEDGSALTVNLNAHYPSIPADATRNVTTWEELFDLCSRNCAGIYKNGVSEYTVVQSIPNYEAMICDIIFSKILPEPTHYDFSVKVQDYLREKLAAERASKNHGLPAEAHEELRRIFLNNADAINNCLVHLTSQPRITSDGVWRQAFELLKGMNSCFGGTVVDTSANPHSNSSTSSATNRNNMLESFGKIIQSFVGTFRTGLVLFEGGPLDLVIRILTVNFQHSAAVANERTTKLQDAFEGTLSIPSPIAKKYAEVFNNLFVCFEVKMCAVNGRLEAGLIGSAFNDYCSVGYWKEGNYFSAQIINEEVIGEIILVAMVLVWSLDWYTDMRTSRAFDEMTVHAMNLHNYLHRIAHFLECACGGNQLQSASRQFMETVIRRAQAEGKTFYKAIDSAPNSPRLKSLVLPSNVMADFTTANFKKILGECFNPIGRAKWAGFYTSQFIGQVNARTGGGVGDSEKKQIQQNNNNNNNHNKQQQANNKQQQSNNNNNNSNSNNNKMVAVRRERDHHAEEDRDEEEYEERIKSHTCYFHPLPAEHNLKKFALSRLVPHATGDCFFGSEFIHFVFKNKKWNIDYEKTKEARAANHKPPKTDEEIKEIVAKKSGTRAKRD